MLNQLALLLVLPAVVGSTPTRKDSDQIREQRVAYTTAIKARQPEAMRRFLAQDMVQLSSTAAFVAGRATVIKSYSENEFRNPAFVAYERVPDTVTISDNGRFAVERGHWQGRFRMPGGKITGNSGLYQAGWIKRDGVWLIRTESYVRLRCGDENDCPK